jgi:hypothetical protein
MSRDTFDSDTKMVSVAGIFMDVTGKPFNADRAATRLLNRMMDAGEYLVVRLPILRIIATQEFVNSDFREAARRSRGDENDLPCVVKYNGRFYATDGHHRLMDAASDGASSAPLRLYDLDGNTQLDFPLLDGLDDDDPEEAQRFRP